MNPIKTRIAANIRAARESLGWSRPQLAEKIGCHKNTIYQYERTEREVDSEAMTKLAEVLRGGNWLWFYQDHEATVSPQAKPAPVPVADETELRKMFESWISGLKTGTHGDVTDLETSRQIHQDAWLELLSRAAS